MRTNDPFVKILVVSRWPLGGIRTYMRYMFSHFPPSCQLTVLAASTLEDAALRKDCEAYRAALQFVKAATTRDFALAVFKALRANKYDVILSQGFISSVAVYWANLFFGIPHVLTIHGIVEPQYLAGKLGFLKRWALGRILSRITVLHAVSKDILEHLYSQFPRLKGHGPQAVVIPNGIELKVLETVPAEQPNLIEMLGFEPETFLFGFLGRFMPQKGFDLLVDAVNILKQQDSGRPFAVVAVGSGDYLREYQSVIHEKGLEDFFRFLPFQPQVYRFYPQLDVVVIPSRWEACPLLPMEALCMGTPLIASDCIGLRETIANTPAIIFPTDNVAALAGLMLAILHDNSKDVFQHFVPTARARYDVQHSAKQLVRVIEHLSERLPETYNKNNC